MSQIAPPESPANHALVVGAGMTGLIIGRVLAEHADRVSILDHDNLPDGPEYRRGAGQMAHTHFMLHRGREIYEGRFPGLVDECTEPKTEPSDMGADFFWHQYGTWKPRVEAGVEMWPVDRAELEWNIRRRVLDIQNVDIVPNRKAVDLFWTDDETLAGVTFETDAGEEDWPAELIVDAMGRGTRIPMLLEQYGFGSVPTESYEPGVAYSTANVTEPTNVERDWRGVLVMPETFNSKKLGVTYPIGGDRFRVTLGGWCDETVPMSESGYLEFAEDLASPVIADVLEDVQFCNEPRRYRIPECEFRRYDQMENRPNGLLVAGDAYCGFNPVYGQGMTIAAREAALLDDLLVESSGELAGRTMLDDYHQRAASIIEESWMLSSGLDHQFPEIESDMTTPNVTGPLVAILQKAAGENPDVYRTFARMMHMKEEPSALLRPGIALKLLGTGLREIWN